MMVYLKNFLRFWYDFIVGDDWIIAAGVLIALALSALFAQRGVAAWWLLPLAVVGATARSLHRTVVRER